MQKETEVRFLNVDRALFDEWLLSLLPSNVEVAAEARLTDVDQTALVVRARMAGCAVAEAHAAHSGVAVAALERYERCLGPMKRNLAFRMGMFPFMNNDACKDMACLVPAPIVSKITERL